MDQSIEAFKNNLTKIRTGRAHTGMLDQVHVDYYGSIGADQPGGQRDAARRAHDQRPAVGKGHGRRRSRRRSASRDLGLNPASQGDLIRVPMPALTEERRKELTKVVRHEGEEAKIAVRNLRRDANDHAEEAAQGQAVSEDDERRAQDEVQKLTDRHIAEIDRLVAAKEAEIMAV